MSKWGRFSAAHFCLQKWDAEKRPHWPALAHPVLIQEALFVFESAHAAAL